MEVEVEEVKVVVVVRVVAVGVAARHLHADAHLVGGRDPILLGDDVRRDRARGVVQLGQRAEVEVGVVDHVVHRVVVQVGELRRVELVLLRLVPVVE